MKFILLTIYFLVALGSPTKLHTEEPLHILIKGSLSPEGMQRLGKPISALRKNELDKRPAASIAESLQSEPGISSSGFSPGASRPIIRGQGKERVRILENGLEVGDVSATSDDHAVSLEPLNTDRIDVLRGPSTLLYGSQAIGGVVNVIDDSIKELPVGKSLSGATESRIGDGATNEKALASKLEGQVDSYNWQIFGAQRSTSDLRVPKSALTEGSRLENSDTSSDTFKAGLSRVNNDSFLGLAIRHTGSGYGIPGSHDHEEAAEHEEEPSTRINLEQNRLELRGAQHLHFKLADSVRYGAAYSRYEHRESELGFISTKYQREAFEFRTLVTHTHDSYLEGGLGIQFNYDSLTASGAEAFIPSSQNTTPAIFFVEDFSINSNWIWQSGLRIENATIDASTQETKNFNNFSASSGLVWQDQDKNYNSGLSLSYSQRAPNATELFANGAHLATQTYEIGDSEINSEKSLGFEVFAKKMKGSFRPGLTFFVQKYQNYIGLFPTGSEIDGFQAYEYNNTAASLWGAEATNVVDLLNYEGHTLSLTTNLDYVRGKDTGNHDNLPRITPMRARIGLEYFFKDFSAFLETQLVHSQNKVAEFETPTSGYGVVNCGTRKTLGNIGIFEFEWFVTGTNLLDKEARNHNSFLKDQVPLRGRAFFTGLNINY